MYAKLDRKDDLRGRGGLRSDRRQWQKASTADHEKTFMAATVGALGPYLNAQRVNSG